MSEKLSRIVESGKFRATIISVIVLAGVLVGLETYPSVMARYGTLLHFLDKVIIVIFVIEIAMRFGAHGEHPFLFFKDPWNSFDFVIVLVGVLPLHMEYVAVLRLARILRVLRLVSVLPRLQLLVGALLKSIPSIGYITVLLFLHFYVYSCLGVYLFGGNDPLHFGTLHQSMVSLFQVVTLEDWAELMYIQMYGSDLWQFEGLPFVAPEPQPRPIVAAFYFISFIMFGTMIILNLFIGVIMNGMSEMQMEYDLQQLAFKRSAKDLNLADEVHLILHDVENIQSQLKLIRHKMEKDVKAQA